MAVAATIAEIRAFNRFYTRFVGALDRDHLRSGLTLAEGRLLYELSIQPGVTASSIVDRLGLDAGYLSRMVKKFEARGLLERRRSGDDARSAILSLTDAGRGLFDDLDSRAASHVGEAIAPLSEQERNRLTTAMGVVTHLLGRRQARAPSASVELRQPAPGDLGWAIERHGALYAAEYGWDERFEGLVAELFGNFARSHNPQRERCWIAELQGDRVGCVFVVERSAQVAQLRRLLVEPSARGRGVGRELVEACIKFARGAGYDEMMLWTNKGLDSARRIYEVAGFRLIEEKPHQDFGPHLIGQNWELTL